MINNNDTFISDEEEELCPLCVEEMDISDKNFKPCPCGYQVCQFCYNNIRQNPELNGRCPACRRVYDDESVEYKIVSQEEWKYEQSKQSRKDREKKQKEKERKEHEQANRKHLAGMRVIQKNLVYVVGLNPPVPSEELHTILRSDKYFGQYGKILKIVINKRNPPPASSNFHHNIANAGFGVYVTFSKKEEAQKCINAIDGTYIDGRPLKAAFGTTKYCSSYLRGQPCPNPNCMFLHEPGEEADSYTRQDLSTRQGLKMGGEGFQKNGAPFVKHANGSQFFNSHDEVAQPIQHEIHSPSNHQSTLNAAPLPSTASWASSNKPAATTTAAVTAVNTSFANSSAFPTLAESTTLQHQQQQHQQQQQRKQKQQNHFSDEFNPEVAPATFVDETINFLNSLSSINYKIRTDVVDGDYVANYPPLFSFNSIKVKRSNTSSFNLKLVESLLPKPSRTIAPQYQSPQAQTPTQQQPQLQDLQQQYFNTQQQQQQQQQHQQAQQQAQQPNAVAQALLQQQLLLQQHQQSQAQDREQSSNVNQLLQEHLLQQQSNQATLLNALKNERSFSATPPPPGLFNANNQTSHVTHNTQVSGTASELLSHLMNGKKISA